MVRAVRTHLKLLFPNVKPCFTLPLRQYFAANFFTQSLACETFLTSEPFFTCRRWPAKLSLRAVKHLVVERLPALT